MSQPLLVFRKVVKCSKSFAQILFLLSSHSRGSETGLQYLKRNGAERIESASAPKVARLQQLDVLFCEMSFGDSRVLGIGNWRTNSAGYPKSIVEFS